MASRREIHEANKAEYRRLYLHYTDEQGVIDRAAAHKDFREYLVDDAERCLPDRVLAAYIEDFDKAHRLRAADLQQPALPGFEERYMPQMDGKDPVWVLQASREQVLSWLSVEATEHQVSVDAYALKARRTAEWFRAWKANHATLGDVLRELYASTAQGA